MATGTKADVRFTRQQSRDRIMAAATELVRTTAFGALTVDGVMREAGVGNRTIFYRHFDDLGDLLRTAGREAFEGLLESEQALRDAHLAGRPNLRSAIVVAVDVYREHGPLLRAITEAAAVGDELMVAGQVAMLERFDALVCDVLWASKRFQGRTSREIVETARALNLLNVNYLLDAYGREERVPRELAIDTLTEIWTRVIG